MVSSLVILKVNLDISFMTNIFFFLFFFLNASFVTDLHLLFAVFPIAVKADCMEWREVSSILYWFLSKLGHERASPTYSWRFFCPHRLSVMSIHDWKLDGARFINGKLLLPPSTFCSLWWHWIPKSVPWIASLSSPRIQSFCFADWNVNKRCLSPEHSIFTDVLTVLPCRSEIGHIIYQVFPSKSDPRFISHLK